MNHFFYINSNGGYFGRIAWANKGSNGADDKGWGAVVWFRTWDGWFRPTHRDSAWAGSIPLLRLLLLQ